MHSRSVRALVGMVVSGLVAGGATAVLTAPDAGAVTTYASKASGRFLTGSILGTSLDNIASIQGEGAENPGGGPTVIKQGSLMASVLNGVIDLPLKEGLQLPSLGLFKLGAVAQYAQTNPDGSAIGASGAINDTGGIGVGGTNGVPPADAVFDLSGLGDGGLTNVLGNLKLTIGAISATANQAAGANGAQTGKYQIAGLTFDLQSSALASVYSTVQILAANSNTLLATLTTAVNGLGLGVLTVTAPDLTVTTKTLAISDLLGGSIKVDLEKGTIVVDLAALLKHLGLDLNKLPVKTSLMPYLVQALAETIPAAITAAINDLSAKLVTALGGIDVKLGDNSVLQNQLVQGAITPILNNVLANLTDTLNFVKNSLAPNGLGNLGSLLAEILDLIVNFQSTSNGTFTQQALQIVVGKRQQSGDTGKKIAAVVEPIARLDLAKGSVSAATAFVGPDPTAAPTESPAPPTVEPTEPPADVVIPAGGAPAMTSPEPGIQFFTPLTFLAFLVGAGAFLLVAPRKRGAHSWS